MEKYTIDFVEKVIDNVHGFIGLTRVEMEICELPIFKRLRDIKQLALANWVFPGAEHTRYNHSLGVMHIADKMAIKLKYSDEERQIVRLAGLLHDIGHYPLSHCGESVYLNKIELEENNYKNEQKRKVVEEIDSLKSNKSVKNKSIKMHHEEIGKLVIMNSKEIKDAIKLSNCDFLKIEDICAIITGDFSYKNELSDKIQLLHSELDADRIDYIMRDSTFAGTTYGFFGIDLLLENLTLKEYKGRKIICIKNKGIPSADQFLIGRFFMYSQVMYNRHVSILSYMSKVIMDYGIKEGLFYNEIEFIKLAKCDEYNSFTDSKFWELVYKLKDGNTSDEIKYYVSSLIKYSHLSHVKCDEVNIVTSKKKAYDKLYKSDIYNSCKSDNNKLPQLRICHITKHVLEEEFLESIIDGKNREEEQIKRFEDGLTVIGDDGEIKLLIDDLRSLTRGMYDSSLYLLREYDIGV